MNIIASKRLLSAMPLLWLLALSALNAGCGIIQYRTARNLPDCPDGTAPALSAQLGIREESRDRQSRMCVADGMPPQRADAPAVPRARQVFGEHDTDVPDVFVGLAISGGGSRAANFGLAAMQQLAEIGMLNHVSAISTTSGGGLPAALYALEGPGIDWTLAKQKMATDFRGRWVVANLLPQNLLSTTFTHEDRSDLMADVLDAALFGGRKYADLGEFKTGTRPIWLANATDSMGNERFTFSGTQFESMRSKLSEYPISQAVVASAAFPGAFNAVTLRHYVHVVRNADLTWRKGLVGYKHLIDGGPTDNLGVEALLGLAVSHHAARPNRQSGSDMPNRCLLIVVDAYPSGVPRRKYWDPDPRGWLDHFVDLNIFDAFDSMLARRRIDLLGYVGIVDSGRQQSHQFVEFDVPVDMRNTDSYSRIQRVNPGGKPQKAPKGYFRCAAWHINLSGLSVINRYEPDPKDGNPRFVRGDAHGLHPLMKYRETLHRVVSQIDTDFKLAGPSQCSPSFLQDALYAAAFVLVREDHDNRRKACDWLTNAKLDVPAACRLFPGNRSMQTLSIEHVTNAAPPIEGQRERDESVKCDAN